VEVSFVKALVAMSGGVDSSVAAYLLTKDRFEVSGISFELWDRRDLSISNTCCSLETIEIAKGVALKLGIEHYSVDVRDAFYTHVIEGFCDSYVSGSTPNPCILCNKYIKFAFLLEKADEIGADIIATGHYARVERPGSYNGIGKGNGRFFLKKGIDLKKDQSYFLYVMTQHELSRVVFPLGAMRKEETRLIAEDIGLANALRAESQEICFVGNGSYIDFIRKVNPDAFKPGPIISEEGKVLGTHKGIAFYTVGQRKRLEIPSLTPFYVVAIDRRNNTIIVGDRKGAMKSRLLVRSLNWISINGLNEPVRAGVKIRSTMMEEPSLITPVRDSVIVEFDNPQWAPASGQSAVFYIDDIVIGGGVIEKEE
jgi:tRNA-specific 2-thiouridylase